MLTSKQIQQSEQLTEDYGSGRDHTVSGPTTKRHKSKQDLETPWEFINKVQGKFGLIWYDLAATDANSKSPLFITPEQNSLSVDWHALPPSNPIHSRLLWLNPPFDPIRPWVEKCRDESRKGAEILLLAQASIDSNWFWDCVQPYATVYAIDRIKFVGQDHVYPKPLMLCHYCANPSRELQRWRWKQ